MKWREKFSQPARGAGDMLPQEMLKIEPLKLADIAFQSNLISNFLYRFYNNLTIFSYKMSCFYC